MKMKHILKTEDGSTITLIFNTEKESYKHILDVTRSVKNGSVKNIKMWVEPVSRPQERTRFI